MCGIVGIINYRGSVSTERLQRANDALRHRGPDDGGIQVIRVPADRPYEVGLANRRLAILDLSPAGHQPMTDPETGNWIVYNGEVYNFRDVRTKLENEGHRFSSQSDTEVVLKAYGKWGPNCLHEFRGMFALAIWDAGRQRLFLARDRMGIKPLYYGQQGDQFFFGSEVRPLLETGLANRELNVSGLSSFLALGSVYDPETIIRGVYSLQAGHYLIWEKGQTEETEYWNVNRPRERVGPQAHASDSSATAKKKILEELGLLLEESARLRLVSDVPVGVFLSGGIDSSAIVALLSREGTTHISTFAIVFEEEDFTEAPFSRLVAQRFKTDHHECLFSQAEALKAIPGAISAMDQPTMDGFNTYVVSREARRAGLKVALSGLGGDELFAGYDTFRTVPRMEQFARFWKRVPNGIRNSVAGIYSGLTPASDRQRKVASLLKYEGGHGNPYLLARGLFTGDQQARLLNVLHKTSGSHQQLKVRVRLQRPLDAVNHVSYLELSNYMLNTLLRDSDVMSMAHGLELRVPLIDHKLVEYVFALPGKMKMNGRAPKHLLVEALKTALPSEAVNRPKRGFAFPFQHWLKDEIRGEVEAALVRVSKSPLGEFLNADSVQGVWSDFLGGRTSWSRPWALYVLQRWCEMHL